MVFSLGMVLSGTQETVRVPDEKPRFAAVDFAKGTDPFTDEILFRYRVLVQLHQAPFESVSERIVDDLSIQIEDSPPSSGSGPSYSILKELKACGGGWALTGVFAAPESVDG